MCVYKNHAFIFRGHPPKWSGTFILTHQPCVSLSLQISISILFCISILSPLIQVCTSIQILFYIWILSSFYSFIFSLTFHISGLPSHFTANFLFVLNAFIPSFQMSGRIVEVHILSWGWGADLVAGGLFHIFPFHDLLSGKVGPPVAWSEVKLAQLKYDHVILGNPSGIQMALKALWLFFCLNTTF
jgi:hypothetical protein